MYEYFRLLSYWKRKHKIKTLWDILRLLLGGVLCGKSYLLLRLKDLENRIDSLVIRIKKYTPGDKDDIYNYDTDFSIEDLGEEEILPDLIITNISTTNKNHYILISVTIKNQGDKIAGENDCGISIEDYDNYDIDIYTPELDINESTTVYTSFPIDENGDPESYDITATADVYDEIEESDENNNTKNSRVSAKTPLDETDPPAIGKGYIIFHMHNPENIELNSITDVGSTNAQIDVTGAESGYPYAYGAHNEATHNSPYEITAGNYLIEGKFNGITLSENVTVTEGQTTIVTFTFSRIEVTTEINNISSHTHFIELYGEATEHSNFDYYPTGEGDEGVFRTRYKGIGTHWISAGSYYQVLSYSGISISVDGMLTEVNGIPFISGQLELGIHAYPWIGGTYIPWSFPVTIGAQSFTNWYVQHGNCVDYINIKYSSKNLSYKDYSGYRLETINADVAITDLDVENGNNANLTIVYNTGQDTWDSSGTIENFHISSVPYDLDGNGIKG